MKKIFQTILKKSNAAFHYIKSGVKNFKVGVKFRSPVLKDILKGLSISAGSSLLTAWIISSLRDSDERTINSSDGFYDSKGNFITPELGKAIDFVRSNIGIFREDRNTPRVVEIQKQVVLDLVYILTFQPDQELAFKSLKIAETATAMGLAGTWFQEEHDSDNLTRYFINMAENDPTSQEVIARMVKVMDVAATGAPII